MFTRMQEDSSEEVSQAAVRGQRRYEANREEAIAYTQAWYRANRERASERSRQYRAENKEAIRAAKKKRAQEKAEHIAAQQHAWYVANRERIRAEWNAAQTPEKRAEAAERTRQWAQANPERKKELRDKWALENPDKVQAVYLRRRARMRNVPADAVGGRELLREQDGLCYLCLQPINERHRFPHPGTLSVDHVIPLAKGGTGLRENLRAAHLRCNVLKGVRELGELA